MKFDRGRLLALLSEHALAFGQFKLASGATSSYYLDCRKVTLASEAINVVASGMLASLEPDWPDAVGGLAIGADPITAAVVAHAGLAGRSLRGFIVRKEPKGHGTGRQVEGPVAPGMRCVILEDVVTSGGSSLKAVEAVRQFGMRVDRVLAIVDRRAGAAEAFARAGLAFEALVTIDEILACAPR